MTQQNVLTSDEKDFESFCHTLFFNDTSLEGGKLAIEMEGRIANYIITLPLVIILPGSIHRGMSGPDALKERIRLEALLEENSMIHGKTYDELSEIQYELLKNQSVQVIHFFLQVYCKILYTLWQQRYTTLKPEEADDILAMILEHTHIADYLNTREKANLLSATRQIHLRALPVQDSLDKERQQVMTFKYLLNIMYMMMQPLIGYKQEFIKVVNRLLPFEPLHSSLLMESHIPSFVIVSVQETEKTTLPLLRAATSDNIIMRPASPIYSDMAQNKILRQIEVFIIEGCQSNVQTNHPLAVHARKVLTAFIKTTSTWQNKLISTADNITGLHHRLIVSGRSGQQYTDQCTRQINQSFIDGIVPDDDALNHVQLIYFWPFDLGGIFPFHSLLAMFLDNFDNVCIDSKMKMSPLSFLANTFEIQQHVVQKYDEKHMLNDLVSIVHVNTQQMTNKNPWQLFYRISANQIRIWLRDNMTRAKGNIWFNELFYLLSNGNKDILDKTRMLAGILNTSVSVLPRQQSCLKESDLPDNVNLSYI